MLEIIPIPALKDNYIWLVINKENGYSAIVDPSQAEPVIDVIHERQLTPAAILITHHHWDHVGGITDITAIYDIPVYTPKNEKVSGSTHPVAEGDVVSIPELNLDLKILDVPGHTAGAVAYYTDEFVFSGDTLFTGGCGRMFEGTAPQMYHSLKKFTSLADETLLYCGHEYTEANLRFALSVEPDNTDLQERLDEVQQRRQQHEVTVPASLELEKLTNPFLRCELDSVINAAASHSGKTLRAPHEVFAAVRQWKDNF